MPGDRQRRHPDALRGAGADGALGGALRDARAAGRSSSRGSSARSRTGGDWLPTPEERFGVLWRFVELLREHFGADERGVGADDALPALAPQLLLPLRAAAGGAVRRGRRASTRCCSRASRRRRPSSPLERLLGDARARNAPEAGRGAAGLAVARRSPRAGRCAWPSRSRPTAAAASCGCRPPRSPASPSSAVSEGRSCSINDLGRLGAESWHYIWLHGRGVLTQPLGQAETQAIEQGGLGLVRSDDAAQPQLSAVRLGGRQDDVGALESV